MLALFPFWALGGNLPPDAEPVFLYTYANAPVEFDLSCYVTEPEDEELTFLVVDPPERGALVAIPPAFVYIPDPNFVGVDFMVILVQDPWGGFDLAAVEVAVLEPEILLSPPTFRIRQKLTVSSPPAALEFNYTGIGLTQQLGDFSLELDATLTATAFSSFRVNLRGRWDGPLGRMWIKSTLYLDPTVPATRTWRSEFRFGLGNFSLRFIPYFDFRTPDRSYNRLRLEGRLGEPTIKVKGEVDFAQWPLEFKDMWLELEDGFLCCEGLEWEARLEADKAGFQEFSVELKGIELGCCAPLDPEVGFRATFTAVDKSVTVDFDLNPVWFLCVRPLVELKLPEDGYGIEAIDLYGYEIRCDLPGDMRLRLATSLNPRKNARVTGNSDYFEVVSLSGTIFPCCGGPGRWMISTYFEGDAGTLFSWGRTAIAWASPINEEITVRARLILDPDEYELEFTWKGIF